MDNIIRKLQLIKENPGYYNALTPEDQAELFLTLFAPKKKIFRKPEVIRGIDGTTPQKDVDYLSREESERIIQELARKERTELERVITERLSQIEKPRDGKDAVITDNLVQLLVDTVTASIKLPDFGTLLVSEPESVRNALELLNGEERLTYKAIDGLDDYEETARLAREPKIIGGGTTETRVRQIIASTLTWSHLKDTWSVAPTLNTTIAGGKVYNYTLDGTTRYRFVPTTYTPTTDAFYTTFSSGLLSGLIVSRG